MAERLRFLALAGVTGALIAARDWSGSPLGPIEQWPQSLLTALGLVLRSPTPIVLLWGTEGVMLYNDAYSVFAGKRHPRLLGSTIREGWPEIADFRDNAMRVGLAGGTLSYRNQELTLDRHGRPEQVWMNLDYSPVPDESGHPAGVMAIVVETTAQVLSERQVRESEQALREGEARWRGLFDAAPFSIIVLDPGTHRILDVNEYACQSYGYSREEFTSLSIRDVDALGDSDAIRTRARQGQIRPGTQEFEARHRTKSGELRDVLVRVTGVRLNGRSVTYGAHFDITDWKRAEEALRSREERLRLAVEAGQLSAWAYDFRTGLGVRDGPLALATPVLPPSDFSFEAWMAAIHPEDRGEVERRFRATANGELERFEVEFRLQATNPKGPLWIKTFGAVVERDAATGDALRMAGVARDVTEQKHAEERQALLSREVDHRAKNALSVALSAMRLTRAPDMKTYVQAVEGRVAALARAQTILAEDRWQGADLETLLRGELTPFLTGSADRSKVRLQGPKVALPATAAQPLAMTFHELATNAVKYGALSAAAGRVTITWHLDDRQRDRALRLRWIEAGGPPIPGPPTRKGFGSRVLDGTVRRQLGGTISSDWAIEGLVCAIEVPLGPGPVPGCA